MRNLHVEVGFQGGLLLGLGFGGPEVVPFSHRGPTHAASFSLPPYCMKAE